jgi:hypothetical protein
MTGCMDWLVKEPIGFQLHPTNFNRDMGFPLGYSWFLAMNMIKQGGPSKIVIREDEQAVWIVVTGRIRPAVHTGAGHCWTSDSIHCSLSITHCETIFCGYKCSMQQRHSSHQPLMIETETVSKMTDTSSTLTQLNAQEDFIARILINEIHCFSDQSEKRL